MAAVRRSCARSLRLVVPCLIALTVALAWGDEHEREGRGGREGSSRRAATTQRTLYKQVPAAAKQKVSYEKDIRPILLENCTRCHGSKRHKGDVRLNTPEGILAGTEDGPLITPGNGAKSSLIAFVTGIGVESEHVMPPPKDDLLTAEEIGLLRAWIDQGAKFDGPK
jgi:mono/diheme cytochrome c family protein